VTIEFCAEQDPLMGLAADVAGFSPANPFYTGSYIEARRMMGFRPWIFSLRQDGKILSACTAFMKSGYLHRSLEITSMPNLPPTAVFWESLMKFCRREGVSHLQVASFGSPAASILAVPGEIERRTRCEHVLDLSKPGLWERLSSNHKRNIKKAQKSHLQLHRSTDAQACQDHARLVMESMGRRKVRGEAVLENAEIQEYFALTQSGAGEFFQARVSNHVLSSILLLKAERGVYYHSAGTSPEGMVCGASPFLVYETANILQTEKMEAFNLGGATELSPGLYRFKTAFGGMQIHLEAAEFFLQGKLKKKFLSAARLVHSDSLQFINYVVRRFKTSTDRETRPPIRDKTDS
jgi:hypothetical protein